MKKLFYNIATTLTITITATTTKMDAGLLFEL